MPLSTDAEVLYRVGARSHGFGSRHAVEPVFSTSIDWPPMDVPTFIQNHEAVVEFLGCWPSFHDAQVICYEAAQDSISLTIHGWLMTAEVDPQGYFVLRIMPS